MAGCDGQWMAWLTENTFDLTIWYTDLLSGDLGRPQTSECGIKLERAA